MGHTEDKSVTDELYITPQPVLDAQFQGVLDSVKDISRYQSIRTFEEAETVVLSELKLVQIGIGVYATQRITCTSSLSQENDMRNCLDKLLGTLIKIYLIIALLHSNNLTSQHIISIILQLKNMSDFAVINSIYATYFTSPLPPSRVTISTNITENVSLSAVISTRPRTGLHVQSRSQWAPANIGPYSQAVSVSS